MLRRLNRNQRFLLAFLFIPACWVANSLCFGFSIELFSKQRLEAARATWESNNIQDYRMIIHPGGYHTGLFGDLLVTIEQGSVVEVATRYFFDFNGPFTPVDNIETYSLDDLQILPSKITDYTMDRLLDIVAAEIENVPSIHITACGRGRYRVDFDPQLGYLRYFAADTYNPYETGISAFFCPGFHAVGESLSIKGFEVIPG